MRTSRKKAVAVAVAATAVGVAVAATAQATAYPEFSTRSTETTASSPQAPVATPEQKSSHGTSHDAGHGTAQAPAGTDEIRDVRAKTETKTEARAKTFYVALSGDQEVGTEGSEEGTATVRVTVDPRGGVVRFKNLAAKLLFIREDEFAPTKFHIHQGAAGVNGDVVVDLTELANQGQTSGRIKIDPALAQDIVEDPAGFYVNYHTISFPQGAVRGQLAG